ncbi:unnamed protein product [[Candida] boidinii]|uniref:Unnamed protein product n=1 Tax=Candida boidinii TaxID=5477 RepID=A0A9W6WAH1_CANBO|nr:unnamed protein product [[Candida] boidinii]GMG33977.1 unnamed protein product [[Candida] boidinii]
MSDIDLDTPFSCQIDDIDLAILRYRTFNKLNNSVTIIIVLQILPTNIQINKNSIEISITKILNLIISINRKITVINLINVNANKIINTSTNNNSNNKIKNKTKT